MQELLTDEQAAQIWAGDTASLTNLDNKGDDAKDIKPVLENDVSEEEEKENKEDVSKPIDSDELTKALSGILEEDEEGDDISVEDEESEESSKEDEKKEIKKTGRKPSDIVSLVNQLVEDEELRGFDEGEVKTIEEAKELIKLNLKEKENEASDKWWETKVSNYSPQIQAILHYAEQGGTDVTPLLSAIAQVEEVVQMNPETEEGQIAIVDEVLKLKGFDEEERKDQIETLKDLDKLKTKAEKFLPELNKMKEKRVQMILQEEEERQKEAQEASRVYMNTIKNTLDKDSIAGISLRKEDKAKVFESLALANHTSLNGKKTNAFIKRLEDLQFGKNADYEKFLNIVYHAIDEEGFMEKLTTKIKNNLTENTVKKLKSSKSTNPNTNEEIETTEIKRNTISKNSFRNPYK